VPASTVPATTAGLPGPAVWLERLRRPDIRLFSRIWCLIFSCSLLLFVIRFLVPAPVGMADEGDGPRLMCGLGVAPVTGGMPRYDAFAYFTFDPSSTCANASVYSSSEHLLLLAARWLTPLLGLSGAVSLVALGLITCVLQSAGIACLACGLRLRLRSTLLVAAALWLVMADAAFFDTYASPYSEGATLSGLLLVAAGMVYLGRGRLGFALGLLLAAAGGYLACLSKEQNDLLAEPVCIAIVLASGRRTGPGLARFLTARTAAAAAVSALLAVASFSYAYSDATSPYTTLLHQEQVVQMIFVDVITPQNGLAANQADLRALGLPVSWATYAGDGFWSPHTVYHDPLYARYAGQLTDANLAAFLLTHPAQLIQTGQLAADYALAFRTNLGSYAPAAGHAPGALESRVAVLSSLVSAIPAGLGLFWLIPLWAAMAAMAIWSLRISRYSAGWQRDTAHAVLLLVGCAIAAFIPAAFFAGVETRHMLGTNLATALAFVVSAILLCSLIRRGISATEAALPGPDPGPAPASAPRPAGLPGQAATPGQAGVPRQGGPPAADEIPVTTAMIIPPR